MQLGFNVGANIQGVYVSGGLQGGGCDGLLTEIGREFILFLTNHTVLNPLNQMGSP